MLTHNDISETDWALVADKQIRDGKVVRVWHNDSDDTIHMEIVYNVDK